MPAALARLVLLPHFSHHRGIKIAIPVQCIFAEQGFGPIPKGAAEPMLDWDAKAHFGAFEKLSGDMPREHLTQRPFHLAGVVLDAERQGPCIFHHAVVEQGNPRFKAHDHAVAKKVAIEGCCALKRNIVYNTILMVANPMKPDIKKTTPSNASMPRIDKAVSLDNQDLLCKS